jgi:hypothetical protein
MTTQCVVLFKVVSDKHASRTSDASRTLLKSGNDLPSGKLRYVVASGMLGSTVQGNRAESYRLRSKYKTKMFGYDEPYLFFRFLVDESALQ